jgi:predicted membrane metal-binding protein
MNASLATVSPETRGLVALGYPLWPLAALALLGRPAPPVRRQAVQALAFNFGCFGLYFGLGALVHVPLLGISALPLFWFLLPVWLVASVVYGFRLFNGEDVRVPLVSDWLDDREERTQSAA